jgi:hypothetical protein
MNQDTSLHAIVQTYLDMVGLTLNEALAIVLVILTGIYIHRTIKFRAARKKVLTQITQATKKLAVVCYKDNLSAHETMDHLVGRLSTMIVDAGYVATEPMGVNAAIEGVRASGLEKKDRTFYSELIALMNNHVRSF